MRRFYQYTGETPLFQAKYLIFQHINHTAAVGNTERAANGSGTGAPDSSSVPAGPGPPGTVRPNADTPPIPRRFPQALPPAPTRSSTRTPGTASKRRETPGSTLPPTARTARTCKQAPAGSRQAARRENRNPPPARRNAPAPAPGNYESGSAAHPRSPAMP